MKNTCKVLLALSAFLVLGCHYNGPRNKKSTIDRNYNLNTEIYCPDSNYRILLLATTKEEVYESILGALQDQLHSGNFGKIKYTALHLSENRTTSIYNTTASELLNRCKLIEFYRKPDGE